MVESCDLSSLNSVRQCAQRLNESEEKIDILVNNAGVYPATRNVALSVPSVISKSLQLSYSCVNDTFHSVVTDLLPSQLFTFLAEQRSDTAQTGRAAVLRHQKQKMVLVQ